MTRQLKSSALDARTIVCIYCGKAQQVGRSAMSIPCRFCQKALNLEDILISGYAARRTIETCGAVVIEPKGDVTVNSIRCATLSIGGRLKGNVICQGAVIIGVSAVVRGDIDAPVLTIAEGATLQGRCTIGGGGKC